MIDENIRDRAMPAWNELLKILGGGRMEREKGQE